MGLLGMYLYWVLGAAGVLFWVALLVVWEVRDRKDHAELRRIEKAYTTPGDSPVCDSKNTSF